jgi:hypothetical protein
MAVTFGTRADLEARIGAARVVQLFDDDGDGLVEGADLATLQQTLGDADDVVTGLLLNKGFTLEQLEILKGDRQVLRAWAGIAAQLAGERRPEWLDDEGLGPFDALGIRARAELKALAAGEIRSVKEAETGGTGMNPILQSDTTDRPFIFNPDPRDGTDRFGPGGF